MRKTPAILAAALTLALHSNLHAKGTGYLFVSSEKDNAISVLDGSSYEIVKQIGTAARPRHLQFSPDHNLIYAACGDGDAIDIIDVAKLELVDRIIGIDDPELFDISADGKTMYISLEDDAKLGILDLDAYFAAREEKPELTIAEPSDDDDFMDDDDDDDDDDGDDDDHDDDDDDGDDDDDESGVAGLSTIEVGAEPEGILAHPNGNTVYVTSEVANLVHVVDLDSQAIAKNVVVGNRPRRFALTPDGKELWVTNELSGSVSVLDATTYDILATLDFLPKGFRPEEVTPVGITMTADGKTAIVGLGRANHIVFVDVASRSIEDYVLVGNRAWNTTLSRDEKHLYVVNGLSDDISVIDMARRAVIKSIPVGRVPHTVLLDD